jgi:hypothetical protein
VSEPERIRITHDDAYHPKVDEVLAREGSFGMRPEQMAAMMSQGQKKTSFFYSSIFYTAVAGMVGALAGWAIVEPFFDDHMLVTDHTGLIFASVAMEVLTAGLAAMLIGAAEGVASRNWSRALTGALVGAGIGLAGALVLYIPTSMIVGVTQMVVEKVGDPKIAADGTFRPDDCNKLGYILWTLGRAVAWAPIGLAVGVAPAIVMRSKKLAFNGIVGGVLGAFAGGLFFNPLATIFSHGDAWVSRGIGFTLVGLGAGAMIGLVENLAKTAWLHVQAGALAGKQFILYKNPTVLGSSPKCEIYLFKDAAIEPKHAAIHTYGTRHEIEDLDSPAGTFVNGQKVNRQPLKNGDRIYLGETVLDFSEKENE